MNGKTAVKPPAVALDLTESVGATLSSPIREDGTVDIHIIRPGLGLGRGRHFYPAQMLQENAANFSNWRVYIDHLSPEAKKAQGGLPRSMHDLGGMIEESWWDGSVPGDGRHDAGAVVGRLRPIGNLRAIIEELPQAVEFSIKAKATDVSQEIMEGAPAWVVEGIHASPGSVDAVTEAGAGGKIADLVEGLDPEACLQEAREAGLAPDPAPEPEATELSETTGQTTGEAQSTDEGDAVKNLEEALQNPRSPLSRAVAARARLAAKELVEAQRAELVEEAKAEGRAEAEQEIVKRDLRDEAHRLIEEAKLPEAAAKKLRGQFDLDSDSLDLTDADDKPAMEQLREAVGTEIAEARELVGELNPTKVTGQGAGQTDDGTAVAPSGQGSFWREHLEEAGISADNAYEVRG
jgi:hypothetical protein